MELISTSRCTASHEEVLAWSGPDRLLSVSKPFLLGAVRADYTK
jgi:hypothetical protein